MESRLMLKTEYSQGMTHIADLYFTAPYKIMSPLSTEVPGQVRILQMAASAGLLSGDHFHGEFHFGPGSRVLYGSQSYEKVFRSKGEQTTKELEIRVDENAHVTFLPYPVIPFGGSDFASHTQIRLAEHCSFSYGDIFTCGRTGMGEYYAMKRFRSVTSVSVGDTLIFRDHTLLAPERYRYNTLGLWEDFTHQGLLFLYAPDMETLLPDVQKLLQHLPFDGRGGISACIDPHAAVVRVLGHRGEDIYRLFEEITMYFS